MPWLLNVSRKIYQTGSLLSHVVYLTVLNSLAIDMDPRMWQKCHALAAGAEERTNKGSVKKAVSDAWVPISGANIQGARLRLFMQCLITALNIWGVSPSIMFLMRNDTNLTCSTYKHCWYILIVISPIFLFYTKIIIFWEQAVMCVILYKSYKALRVEIIFRAHSVLFQKCCFDGKMMNASLSL